MKILTSILLLGIMALSATCQEPDTLLYYTQHDVDSIKADYESQLANCQSEIFEMTINDTTHFNILGKNDNTVTTINKRGENITVSIQNGADRLTAIFNDLGRQVFFMNDTITQGSFQLDNNNKVIIYYQP